MPVWDAHTARQPRRNYTEHATSRPSERSASTSPALFTVGASSSACPAPYFALPSASTFGNELAAPAILGTVSGRRYRPCPASTARTPLFVSPQYTLQVVRICEHSPNATSRGITGSQPSAGVTAIVEGTEHIFRFLPIGCSVLNLWQPAKYVSCFVPADCKPASLPSLRSVHLESHDRTLFFAMRNSSGAVVAFLLYGLFPTKKRPR